MDIEYDGEWWVVIDECGFPIGYFDTKLEAEEYADGIDPD